MNQDKRCPNCTFSMETVQNVFALARETESLRKKVDTFDDQMDSLVGTSVTYRVKRGKKVYYHECMVESWNGESWEIVEESIDDPEFFEVTFEDFVQGNLWASSAN